MIHATTSILGRVARFGLVIPLAIGSTFFISPVHAQDDGEEAFFEEIIVTVQRREQNIMDVPVAVSTMSGQQIEQAGIKDVFDLQQNVPGLLMNRSQTSTSANFNIRSIGSTSNNFGVESSVGLYVDGIYRSRQSSMINDLIDVERIEVLRGPQGTLFGKNTAAGAIAVRTVAPSQDRDSFVSVTAGDYGLMKVSAGANIPLNDNIAFRGTVFGTQRDGIVSDLALGDDVYNDRDRVGARLQLAGGEPGDDFSWRLIADYAEIDEICCAAMPRIDSLIMKGGLPIVLQAAATGDFDLIMAAVNQTAGSDFINANLGGTVFATHNYPQQLIDQFNPLVLGNIIGGASWDDYVTAMNFLPISQNEDMGLSFELNKVLGNGISFKSISAFRSFDTYDDIDGDFSDVPLIRRINDAEQSSFSQEFQFSGEFGNGSSWVAGAYYFGQDLDSKKETTAEALFNTFALAGDPDSAALLTFAGTPPPNGLGLPVSQPFPAGATSYDDIKQNHEGYAAFGQVDFSMSDKFTLSLGARYTDETKDIDATYTQTANGPPPDIRPLVIDPLTGLPDESMTVPNPYDPTQMWPVSGAIQTSLFYLVGLGDASRIPAAFFPIIQPNVAWGMYLFPPFAPRPNIVDSLSDDQVTGTVKATFFPTDSTMIYLSYSTGFKAGGTNADRIDVNFEQLFDAETSKSIELGLKGQYGPVRIVATLYQTDFEDFQANSFTGTGFNLQNAGDLEIKGVEFEVLWRPTDSTEVSAWFARNEGEFITFEAGTAWDSWVKQIGAWQGMGDPGCGGTFDPNNIPNSCPRSGEPLPGNPENRLFGSITQEFDLSANTTGFARLEYSHISDHNTDGDNDPLMHQDSFELVNVRFGLNFDDSNSSLTLWGRNITDQRYYIQSFDQPVALDRANSYATEPSTWGITYQKNFD